jgi:hypothetical protein
VKLVIGFISGLVVCGLLLFGIRSAIPTRAETDDTSGASDNLTQRVLNILPDFEKIYRQALTLPFQKAESKIYDKDIADFYRELLDKTGLREPGNGTQ